MTKIGCTCFGRKVHFFPNFTKICLKGRQKTRPWPYIYIYIYKLGDFHRDLKGNLLIATGACTTPIIEIFPPSQVNTPFGNSRILGGKSNLEPSVYTFSYRAFYHTPFAGQPASVAPDVKNF